MWVSGSHRAVICHAFVVCSVPELKVLKEKDLLKIADVLQEVCNVVVVVVALMLLLCCW